MRKLTHDELIEQRLSAESAQTAPRHPVSLIIENVRSLYNVGSIFRSADSFWLTDLILCGFTPAPPRKEIAKTALGADKTVPFQHMTDAVEAVRQKQALGWTVLALELTTEAITMDALPSTSYPLCLVVGNELTGVSAEALEACDGSVQIPMHGVKHSLNVAVATGIALYEAIRQQP